MLFVMYNVERTLFCTGMKETNEGERCLQYTTARGQFIQQHETTPDCTELNEPGPLIHGVPDITNDQSNQNPKQSPALAIEAGSIDISSFTRYHFFPLKQDQLLIYE